MNKREIDCTQGYRFSDAEKMLSNLKENKDIQNLSEDTLCALVLAEPSIILTIKNPSESIILNSLKATNEYLINISSESITDAVLFQALETDLRNEKRRDAKPSLSYSLRHSLEKLKKISKENQVFLIENFSLYDERIFKLLSEENIIKAITLDHAVFKYIKKPTFEMCKIALKKNYNNVEFVQRHESIKNIDKLILFHELIEEKEKAIKLIDIVKNFDKEKALKTLSSKIELLKAME